MATVLISLSGLFISIMIKAALLAIAAPAQFDDDPTAVLAVLPDLLMLSMATLWTANEATLPERRGELNYGFICLFVCFVVGLGLALVLRINPTDAFFMVIMLPNILGLVTVTFSVYIVFEVTS